MRNFGVPLRGTDLKCRLRDNAILFPLAILLSRRQTQRRNRFEIARRRRAFRNSSLLIPNSSLTVAPFIRLIATNAPLCFVLK